VPFTVLEPVGIDSNVNKLVINILLFRKGLKEWAQLGIVKDYLIVHLWDASLGCQSKLVGVSDAS
jgi:hypothetical protein